MTRLARQHRAINLAQGFTDEPPPFPLVWGAITALLGGSDEGIRRIERVLAADSVADRGATLLRDALEPLQGRRDELNQYSYPFGLPELRQAIAAHTARWSGFEPDPETETTVVLGSTRDWRRCWPGSAAAATASWSWSRSTRCTPRRRTSSG